MARVQITAVVDIDAGAERVRRQFGDVAHHAETHVHRGVVFEVIDETDGRCRYRQVSKVGPISIQQIFELERTSQGPLVNRIVEGPFRGGSITFDVEPNGDTAATVRATLEANMSGPMRLAVPLLKRQVSRQLAAALLEDKADLENGRYPNQPPQD